MGGKTRQTLFKATGILMFVSFILAIAVFASFFSVLFPVAFSLGSGSFEPSVFLSLLPLLGVFFVVSIAAAVIGLATFILELASHFRASNIYMSRWFRRAGWMRIVTIILAAVVLAAIVAFMPSILAGGSFPDLLGPTFLLAFIPLFIVGLLGPIFSAIAFFSLPEETPPPPPPAPTV
ncbi:MAG: hypothetical protein QW064_07705 [Candidatus Caldarchaeum sp.]